jgi:membrane protein
MRPARVWTILKSALADSDRDSIPRLGAALAFYSLFSLAPVILIVLAAGSVVLGPDLARSEIQVHIARVLGERGAQVVTSVMQNASLGFPSGPQAAVTVLFFFLGSTAAFNAVLSTLNHIWDVREDGSSWWWRLVRRRLIAFGLVLMLGALAVVSLVLTALLARIESYLPSFIAQLPFLTQVLNLIAWVLLLTLMFGAIYRVVPDAPLQWRDVLVGAAVTALLFVAGTTLIGIYIGRVGFSSVFGAAGSMVMLLFWVYYSSQVFLFGAELTHAFVRARDGEL